MVFDAHFGGETLYYCPGADHRRHLSHIVDLVASPRSCGWASREQFIKQKKVTEGATECAPTPTPTA